MSDVENLHYLMMLRHGPYKYVNAHGSINMSQYRDKSAQR